MAGDEFPDNAHKKSKTAAAAAAAIRLIRISPDDGPDVASRPLGSGAEPQSRLQAFLQARQSSVFRPE
jgi:hypothetical protein